MSCDEAERALNARLDGQPFDAAALETHLAACGACRSATEELDEIRALFRRARAEWRPSRELKPRLPLPWRRWAAAAAILFIPLAGWAFTVVRPEPAEIDVSTIVSSNGESRQPWNARDVLGTVFLTEDQP